jgi:hypothetical protein
MWRRFGWISGIEGAAIFAIVAVLNIVRRPNAIAPAIAILVGLHFLPLAAVFNAPLYYGAGILGCVIGLAGFMISDPPLRSSFVGLSFGLMLWVTSAMVLLQSVRLMRS